MPNEGLKLLAHNLFSSVEIPGYEPEYPVLAGVPITYPYFDVKYAAWDDFVPPTVYQNYSLLQELFEANPLPPKWLDFIASLKVPREVCGNRYPLDLVTGIFFLINENPEICAHFGIVQFSFDSENQFVFSDISEVINKIDSVLNEPTLRNILFFSLVKQIPDRSTQWISRNEVQKTFYQIRSQEGLIVDFGCGTGENTLEWAKTLGEGIIGLDRQYHPNYYHPWHQSEDNHFFCADAIHTPIASDSAKLILLDSVLPHITEAALISILTEAQRILKQGGYLACAPHEYQNNTGCWRFLKKTETGLQLV